MTSPTSVECSERGTFISLWSEEVSQKPVVTRPHERPTGCSSEKTANVRLLGMKSYEERRRLSNVSFAWPGAGHLNGPFGDLALEPSERVLDLSNQASSCVPWSKVNVFWIFCCSMQAGLCICTRVVHWWTEQPKYFLHIMNWFWASILILVCGNRVSVLDVSAHGVEQKVLLVAPKVMD